MADSKLADLTEDTAPLTTDIVYVVHDPAGTPVDRKVTVAHLRGSQGWNPMAPPATAHASDDEFADNSGGVPGGWTEFDAGSTLTVTEEEFGVRLRRANDASNRRAGIYKATPAGDFAVWTRLGLLMPNSNFKGAGLFVAQDIASLGTGADRHEIHVQYTTTPGRYVSIVSMTSDTTIGGGGTDINLGNYSVTGLYLRIRVIGTTTYFDYSFDGIGWLNFWSLTSLSGLASVGISAWNNGAPTFDAVFPFIRFSTNTSEFAVPAGRRT